MMAYITDLAEYVGGELVGEWISFPVEDLYKKRRMNNMKDTFTFEHMGTASTDYLKKALENPEKYRKEQRSKALEVIKEILQEDEEIKNKKHIKRIK